MSRWKKGSSSAAIIGVTSPSSARGSSRKSVRGKDNSDLGTNASENDEDDLHSTTLTTHLLFPKESPLPSKDPLFPVSRKKFFIMTCKRTLFGCRGLILFCLIVFIVITLVSSHSSNITTGEPGSRTGTDSPNFSKTTGTNGSGHRLETVLLPPSVKGNSKGNLSDILVKYNVNCTYKSSDFAVIGNALRKGLEFFELNVANITVLDAALGAKIVSEQLHQIQELHKKLPANIELFLHDLEAEAKTLTEQLTNTVIRAAGNKTEDLKFTLPWIQMKEMWKLPANNAWYPVGKLESYNPPDSESFENLWDIASRKEMINETESDACIYQVFHCDTVNVTQRCQEVFLQKERSMYSLTHQVIYMLVVQQNKCFEKSSWSQVSTLKESGHPFMEKLCGKVWQEANSIAEESFPPRFRDLFIEQIGMCSLAGYSDFLRRDWLRRIISWQSITTSGCFGYGKNKRRAPPTIGMLLREYQKVQAQQNNQHAKSYGTVRRYKRSDVFLNGDNDQEKCSAHYTSVGVTVLAVHLHNFIDTCLDTY